ncbi:hypothetical protein L7F22_065857 [Adiantum nelumboides]|nr:hypothetical protein [Adiantum nelumboides]
MEKFMPDVMCAEGVQGMQPVILKFWALPRRSRYPNLQCKLLVFAVSRASCVGIGQSKVVGGVLARSGRTSPFYPETFPFAVVNRGHYQPRSPMAVSLEKEKIQSVKGFLEDMNDMLKAIRKSIRSARDRVKTYANKARRKDAGSCFTSGKMSQAIELLKNAIKKEPEKGEAYALLGLLYKTQKDWVNSAVYYKQAISKAETDDFKIAAYAGCGLALLKEGVVMECIETLRSIRSFQVPERPDSRHCYYASLVILGRALLEAGLKEESREVVQLYKELGMDKSEVK